MLVLQFSFNFDVIMEEGEHSVYLLHHLEKRSREVDFLFLFFLGGTFTLNFFWSYKLTSLLAAHYFHLVINKNHLLLITSMAAL